MTENEETIFEVFPEEIAKQIDINKLLTFIWENEMLLDFSQSTPYWYISVYRKNTEEIGFDLLQEFAELFKQEVEQISVIPFRYIDPDPDNSETEVDSSIELVLAIPRKEEESDDT
jgi:hypothetical protein